MKFFRALAWLLSGLFHPLILGVVLPSSALFLELAAQGVSTWAQSQLLLWTGMLVIPVLLLLLLKKQGRVQSLLLSIREERNVVYLVSFLWFFSFAALMQLLQWFGPESRVYGFLWLNTISAVLLWQVNMRVNKVSAHATAGSALLIYLAFLPPYSAWIFPMSLIFLLIVASRALLKAHSVAELITGSLCGALAATMVLWLR
jgi:hypothetical protein